RSRRVAPRRVVDVVIVRPLLRCLLSCRPPWHAAARGCQATLLWDGADPLTSPNRKAGRRSLAQITFPVEATHIMMFARALDDPTGVSHDPKARATAPPPCVQAVAHFDPASHMPPKPGQPGFGPAKTASGIEGKPASSGGLHAEQHYEYHRH